MTEEQRERKNAYARAWRSRNKARQAALNKNHRQRVRQKEQEDRVLRVEGNRARAMKQSANKRGLPFEIDGLALSLPDRCPMLNIPLDWRDRNNTPTIDRIDNTKGYIPGNVWVISHKANVMKQEMPIEVARMVTNPWALARLSAPGAMAARN